MKDLGYTGGVTRRAVRAEVARQYPSIQIYRRAITPYEVQKAEAGKFFYGSTQQSWWEKNKNKPGVYIPLIIGIWMFATRNR